MVKDELQNILKQLGLMTGDLVPYITPTKFDTAEEQFLIQEYNKKRGDLKNDDR